MAFQPGTIVMLKSGGPAMTVAAAEKDGVRCVWHAETTGQIHEFTLPAASTNSFSMTTRMKNSKTKKKTRSEAFLGGGRQEAALAHAGRSPNVHSLWAIKFQTKTTPVVTMRAGT